MFFSRKPAKSGPTLADHVAEYYSVSPDIAASWCSEEEEGVKVILPFCARSQHKALADYLQKALAEKGDNRPVDVRQRVGSADTKVAPVNNVRNIIAVASGKGGVGKSSTAVNLAFALQQEGASVGLLDADIYGPSVPIMLGNPDARPQSNDNKTMTPIDAYGVVANSIGYLVPPDDAAVWRGPMASRALKQLIDETRWPVLDYLIVDLPPGTGDIQLTLAQQIPVSGAVVVTTPQDLALADAQKGIAMFNKVQVPVLGLIENMSYFECKACGTRDFIFDQHGGEKLAERYELPLLGAFPLDKTIREHADAGTPLLVTQPDSALADAYRQAARALSMQLALTQPARENGEGHIKGEPIGVRIQN